MANDQVMVSPTCIDQVMVSPTCIYQVMVSPHLCFGRLPFGFWGRKKFSIHRTYTDQPTNGSTDGPTERPT